MADELMQVSNRLEQNASETWETVLHAGFEESVAAVRARFPAQIGNSLSALPAA